LRGGREKKKLETKENNRKKKKGPSAKYVYGKHRVTRDQRVKVGSGGQTSRTETENGIVVGAKLTTEGLRHTMKGKMMAK